jgi:hypothetical protein
MTPGSIVPQRVPIIRPSTVEKLIVVAMLRPPERTEAAAATQVSDDRAPARGPDVELRKYCCDVFVGQTVESIALEALIVEASRQRKRLRDGWLGPVKGRIETRDLRQVRR